MLIDAEVKQEPRSPGKKKDEAGDIEDIISDFGYLSVPSPISHTPTNTSQHHQRHLPRLPQIRHLHVL